MRNVRIRLLARTFILLVLIGLIMTMSRCSHQKPVNRSVDVMEDLMEIPESHQPEHVAEDYTQILIPPPNVKMAPLNLQELANEEVLLEVEFDLKISEELLDRDRVFNTEEYNLIVENDFKPAWDNPLSTFSIDVDKASYANVRRFLSYHQMPPKDAVRIEEMINYFSYGYSQPEGPYPFSVVTEIGECPWNRENKIIHIGVQGKSLDFEDIKQGNYVFLIDVSGSMDMSDKLPLVKQSLNIMLEHLRPDDKVAIVVYAGAAGLVLPATPANQKETIRKAINRLSAGGSTAGGEGILLAYKIAADNLVPDGNNRIILATDGDFNVGVSSTSEMVRLVEEKRKEGIFLTICGYGMGNYKDGRLEQISAAGNGVYFYIDNIREAKRVFARDLRANLFTIAKDVKIQVEFNPLKVKSYRLIGYENRQIAREDFDNDQKDAGELGAGHSVTALYEIIPANVTEAQVSTMRYQQNNATAMADSKEWMILKLRYKPIYSNESLLIEKQVLENGSETVSQAKQWAEAVAGFGMLLRESKYKGDLTYEKLLATLKNLSAIDEQDKWELVKLVETACLLSQQQADPKF